MRTHPILGGFLSLRKTERLNPHELHPIVNTLQPLKYLIRCKAQIPKHAPCWIDGHLDFPVGGCEPRPSKFGKTHMHYGDIDEMGQLHHPPKAVSAYTAFGTYSIVSYFVLFHEANIGKKSSAGLVPSWRSFAGTMTF